MRPSLSSLAHPVCGSLLFSVPFVQSPYSLNNQIVIIANRVYGIS